LNESFPHGINQMVSSQRNPILNVVIFPADISLESFAKAANNLFQEIVE